VDGRWAWRCGIAAAVLTGALAAAEAADNADLKIQQRPTSAMLGIERLRLPGGERMGLMGGAYVFELTPGWWFGPAVYGAATGHRGGLFTWGGEGQRRWRLTDEFGVVAGLYVGGGGGAGAPVGGGLMLRPHADFMLDLGGWQAGITASQVRFPSGNIKSTQLGLLVMVEDRFAYAPPGHAGESVRFGGRGGLGADRMQVVLGRYSGRTDNAPPLSYVGLRLEQDWSRTFAATLEAAGAAQGGSDGYAEVLGGLSALFPLGTERIKVGARGALGLAGGGSVKTGAGPIGKAALTGRVQLTKRTWLQMEAGKAKSLKGEFGARYADVSFGMALSDLPKTGDWDARQTLHDMAWSISLQDYRRAARRDGSKRAMQLIGLKFERALSDHFYLTGQAISAVAGGAGAYSAGLVGLGATTGRWSKDLPWRAGVEALAGAGGGGGVASQGGAIVQPMAWIGRDLGTYSQLRLGAGVVKSVKGDLKSPVLDLTWSLAFGVP